MATIVLHVKSTKKAAEVIRAHVLHGREDSTVREHGRTLRPAEIRALIRELAGKD